MYLHVHAVNLTVNIPLHVYPLDARLYPAVHPHEYEPAVLLHVQFTQVSQFIQGAVFKGISYLLQVFKKISLNYTFLLLTRFILIF
jgi:hypothetical protein